jgi:hypothetical protein
MGASKFNGQISALNYQVIILGRQRTFSCLQLMPATAWLNSSYPRRFLHSLACSSRPSTAPTFVACASNRLPPLCGEAEGDHLSRLLGVTVGQSEIPVRWPVATAKMGREHPDRRAGAGVEQGG